MKSARINSYNSIISLEARRARDSLKSFDARWAVKSPKSLNALKPANAQKLLYSRGEAGSLVLREAPTSRYSFDSRRAHKSPGSPNSPKPANSRAPLDSRRARDSLKKITDNKLVARLEKLRDEERAVQLKILYYLNEMERRRLYLPRGYSSLFEFCTGHLKYSKPAAWRRIQAARCIERFPKVAKLLLSGRLSLTVVSMISKILTPENATEILSWTAGKSTRDIEVLVSRHQPGKIQRDRVKPVCIMTPVEPQKPECQADLTFSSGAGTKIKARLTSTSGSKSLENKANAGNIGANNASSSSGAEELERVVIEQCFKLEFMVKSGFMEKVERLKAMLSNKYPQGLEFERLFEILMDEYLERNAPESRIKKRAERKRRSSDKQQNTRKERRGSSDPANKKRSMNIKPGQNGKRRHASNPDTRSRRQADPDTGTRHTKNPGAKTRHIPKALQDKVYARDNGRCTFVGHDGKRCNSRRNLQIDHKIPYARGGKHTLDNLRLLCAKHNRLEAEKAYGRDFMKRFRRLE